MTSFQEKVVRLDESRRRVELFVEEGGDLKLIEATPMGLEFLRAANDVASELGYEFIKKIKKPE